MKPYIQHHHDSKGQWWKTYTEHVDIDTGEMLSKTRAQNKKLYTLIKTHKHETERTATGLNINRYTKQYRRNPQGRLFN